MSVLVKEVQKLNKRIENINTERTRVETKSQMLKEQILTEIAEYEKQFGVNLSGKKFSDIKKLVSEEAKKVSEEVSKEYKLKESVVSCIESGDISGANKLLGIKEEVEETKELPDNKVTESDENGFSDESFSTDFEVKENSSTSEEENIDNTLASSEEDDFELESSDILNDMEDESEKEVKKETSTAEISIDIEEDEDPFGFGEMLNGGKF